MKRLYIIDDHSLIGSGFKYEYEFEGLEFEVAGGALDLESAIKEIPILKIDLIILDLFLGYSDPIANIKLLRFRFPLIPVIILTFEMSLEWQCKMFKEGASAFLSKSDKPTNFIITFRQVLEGQIIIPIEVMKMINTGMESGPDLTQKERQIVQDLCKGVSVREIAEKGEHSLSAIDKTLKSLRDKFRVKTTYELISQLVKTNKI
jgi:DNA-binding NarL/FixJ family response regulator